jgi:hypothetical protein
VSRNIIAKFYKENVYSHFSQMRIDISRWVLRLSGFDITGLDSTLDWLTCSVTGTMYRAGSAIKWCLPIQSTGYHSRFLWEFTLQVLKFFYVCVCDVLVFLLFFVCVPCLCFFVFCPLFISIFAMSLDFDLCSYPIVCSFSILLPLFYIKK